MTTILNGLLPIILLIALGHALTHFRFLSSEGWTPLERLSYYVFFPALSVDTLASADLASVQLLGAASAMIGAILIMAAFLILIRLPLLRLAGVDGPAFTSLFQGSTRWNSFIGLALAIALVGPRGATLTAIAIAAMVPLLNILAVSVLTRYAGGHRQHVGVLIKTILTNPFIWSTLLGIALNIAGNPLPKLLMSGVGSLGKATLPCGLLLVGAGLDLAMLRRPSLPVALSVVLKLVILPLIAVQLARSFGVKGDDLLVTAICTSVPTAAASYILAKRMGGDAPLMSAIITIQTIVAIVTLPAILWFALR